MRVAIVGGGAAGFFAAIHVKENHPNADVTIFEKSQKVLSKVKISGGGRCNVTNACTSISELAKAYPRGGKQLKKIFPKFYTKHTMEWFEKRDIPLVTQQDNCVFPKSQNSQTIIDCFLNETIRLGVSIQLGSPITKIKKYDSQFCLIIRDQETIVDQVIITTGGSPKLSGLKWLAELGHKIEPPVPSLFTFNMPHESIKSLMGIVVEQARVKIVGEKWEGQGPLLITHWGMSGPAILVLSSFGARRLSEMNYSFDIEVNWIDQPNHENVRKELDQLIDKHGEKQVSSIRPYFLPSRLWLFLIEKHSIPKDKKWKELSKKENNKIIQFMTNDRYKVEGKTTFKEEFVTCGGVSLEDVNIKTMESKKCPGLYFAGEVLDIDAITGGYNFQAAWTTSYIAAQLKT